MFDMVPNCHVYDPSFGFELAVIIHHGLERMYGKQEDVFYYLTLINDHYQQPAMPEGCEQGIIKGMYLFKPNDQAQIQLLGSGAIMVQVMQAAEILKNDFNIESNLWSVPSFSEVAHDLREVNRENRLNPENEPKQAYVSQCLNGTKGPVLAASDYINMNAEQIRGGIDKPYYVLGTDGFGRSDTYKNLREFFEVDAHYIAYSALYALAEAGEFDQAALLKARKQLNIDPNHPDPVYS
jgi:pyruvate dehydrogenase E1 component